MIDVIVLRRVGAVKVEDVQIRGVVKLHIILIIPVVDAELISGRSIILMIIIELSVGEFQHTQRRDQLHQMRIVLLLVTTLVVLILTDILAADIIDLIQ